MHSKDIIIEKKWNFLLCFLITFFNPCFFFWADNLTTHVKVAAIITCFFVYLASTSISFFLKNKAEKIFLCIFFILSLVPNTVVWSYLYMSETYMHRDMFWVLYGSNMTESEEYFEQFISWPMYVMAFVYIVGGIFLLCKSGSTRALSVKKYTAYFTTCILIIVSVFSFQYLTTGVSTFDYYVSGVKYILESRKVKEEVKLRKASPIKTSCTLSDPNQVFVVIIGESLTRNHMHIYGYQRETTPELDQIKNELDVYSDVIAPDTHTIGVLKKVLTFADHKHPKYYTEKPSVIELFESAGFETYWVSNQEFLSKWGGSYGVIAAEANHVYDLRIAQQDDEIVLPVIESILQDPYKRKIIFVHLMGSHHLYSARYPDEFKYFDYRTDSIPYKPFLNDEMKQTIDDYDNSVRYTDYIVSDIIHQVKALDQSSFVLFFSDHGEEVYDVRNASGHHMSNVYAGQCEIPFILWRSDKYKQEETNIEINTSRPYSTEDLIFGLSTLAGLRYKDYKPEFSLFSREYKRPAKRLVGKEDYDQGILKKKY